LLADQSRKSLALDISIEAGTENIELTETFLHPKAKLSIIDKAGKLGSFSDDIDSITAFTEAYFSVDNLSKLSGQ